MSGPGNGTGPEPGSRTIIPLMAGVARPRGERRAAMRAAVAEVIGHLGARPGVSLAQLAAPLLGG